MSKLSKSEIADLDKWIEQLKDCQPLEECQVKILCEKVNKNNNYFIYFFLIGKRNPQTRAKCPTSKSPSNCVWRYSWPIF